MSYSQEIYDAARSRISSCDVGAAIREVAREAFDLGVARMVLQEQIGAIGYEMSRPSVIFRPTITQDGDHFLVILGDLPSGVVGTGKSPDEATKDFDAAWYRVAKAPPQIAS